MDQNRGEQSVGQSSDENIQKFHRSLMGTFLGSLIIVLSPYLGALITGSPGESWPKWFHYSYLVVTVVAFINIFLKIKWLNEVVMILSTMGVFGLLFLKIAGH